MRETVLNSTEGRPAVSETIDSVETKPAKCRLSTTSVHAGEARQKPGNSITDPIFCAATYTFPDSQSVIDYIQQRLPREEYGRYGNPSEKVVERKLAAMEGAEEAVLFSSGMAAIAGFLIAHLKAGDEVVLFNECYHRTRQICSETLGKFGVITHTVPACDYDAMDAAVNRKTRLLISESPTNPHMSVVDLERFAGIGRRHGVPTLIDATLATPYNVRPIEYGVDFVLHSCTKYLAGHNDVLAGSIAGRTEALKPTRKMRGVTGSINAPHNTYLLQRGLKTFELRMERHNQNGLALAEFLASHPRVEKVYYPGLPGHPYYDIARRTMRGFGGLVTFQVRGADLQKTSRVVDAVELPRIGPSLGGVESLIEQPAIMSFHDYTREQREAVGIFDNMIRVSCGIENTEDLLADFEQALNR